MEEERRKQQRDFEEKIFNKLEDINLRLQRLEDSSGSKFDSCQNKFDDRYFKKSELESFNNARKIVNDSLYVKHENVETYFEKFYVRKKKAEMEEKEKHEESMIRKVTLLEKLANLLSKWIIPIAILLLLAQQQLGGINVS